MNVKPVPIEGYEKYTVDTCGRVYNTKTKKFLKTANDHGYRRVQLTTDDGVEKRFRVHRLVAMAFIPNPKGYPIINHKDENKSNNNVENLEWCTYKYNLNYGSAQKNRIANTDCKSEARKAAARRNGKLSSKPVVQYDMSGNVINTFPSISEAQRVMHISGITSCCKRRTRYSHVGGYVWRYAEDSYE